MDKLVEQFSTVTGVTDMQIARNYLEACGGNIDMAISMHMDNSGPLVTSMSAAAAANEAAAADTDIESVRAPIPQKREVLVEHDQYLIPNHLKRRKDRDSIFDRFRDFQAEEREQEHNSNNGSRHSSSSSAHNTRLEDLFRPPLDIIHNGTFESAQAKAKLDNKWILVNIQNTLEFSCQILNRDIWKDPHIRSLVTKHFIFWQVYHDSTEGRKYTQFYPVTDWPYIAILHPLTAELQNTWNAVSLSSFTKDLEEFIRIHAKPDGTEKTTPVTDSPLKVVDPKLEISEESQLEAAIRASLQYSHKSETELLVSDSDEGEESELETFTSSDDDSPQEQKASPHSKSKGKQLQSGYQTNKSSRHSETSLPKQGETSLPKHSETSLPKHSETSLPKEESSNWQNYTSTEGTDIQILFRKPDQSRCQWCVKSQSKLKALILYVSNLGFEEHKYEIVANFPRRKISDLSPTQTFDDCNFQRQETFYIQER